MDVDPNRQETRTTKARVFISYSRKDLPFADKLEAALKARSFETLIDRSDIYALEDWWKRIEALITRADTVVFVLSPDAVASEVALKEVTFAASLNKRFAPIVCRRVDGAIPAAMAKLNFIFFDDPARFEDSADKLGEALTTDIGWIRQHTEFGEQARRWAETRANGLLLRSSVLEGAERWIATRPAGAPEPTEATQAFIRQSRRAATRRRNVLTGSLAAGLLVALALAGLAYWQRGVAIEQRAIAQKNVAQADRNFKLAQKTAQSLVFDIAQGLRNVQGMRAETVRKILGTARSTFEQLTMSSPDEPALQRSRAAMLVEFGETYSTLGDLEQALTVYRESATIDEQLVAADRGNVNRYHDLSVSYERIGDVLAAQGKLDEARKSYLSSLTIAKIIAVAEPDNALRQHELSISNDKLGTVLAEQGKFDDALKAYRDGLAIAERLAAAEPSNVVWQRTLSGFYQRVGDVLAEQRNFDEALRFCRDNLVMAERLAAADRSNMLWQRDLSSSYHSIGNALLGLGRLDEALKAYRDSLAVAEQLVTADRANTQWQRNQSFSYISISEILLAQGKLDEALKASHDGLVITQRLVAADRSNRLWQRDLLVCYNKIGNILVADGKLDEALKAYRDGLVIIEELVAADRSNNRWERDLQYSIGRIGSMAYHFILAHRFVPALEAADQAIALAPDRIWLYVNRAHALMFLDRLDEALAVYLRYRGEKNVQRDKPWETIILEDLAELRKAGLTHPLMDEIEKRLAAGG